MECSEEGSVMTTAASGLPARASSTLTHQSNLADTWSAIDGSLYYMAKPYSTKGDYKAVLLHGTAMSCTAMNAR
jgi:hypothetical protein